MADQSSRNDPTVRHGFPRREFLKRSAAATGGVIALTATPIEPAAAQTPPANPSPAAAATPASQGPYTPVALSQDEFETLKAVVARIIPADDIGPGAAEAGVHIYIDRSLGSAYASALPTYREHLQILNAAAIQQGGLFAGLPADTQDDLLNQLASPLGAGGSATPVAGATPETNVTGTNAHGGSTETTAIISGASPDFFPLLLEHVREGMFGDPMYGGNANFAGWDLIGYPGIKLLWTEEEQKIGTSIKPAHVSAAKFGGHPVQ